MNTSRKTIVTLALMLSLITGTWASNKFVKTPIDGEKSIKSKIKDVTVFLNRAQVTNIARVYLAAGKTKLIFEGLSTKMDKQSLQVSAKGNLTIMAVKHRINYLKSFSKAKRIKQLEDSINYLNDRVANVNIEK
jgi:hypothetical protein